MELNTVFWAVVTYKSRYINTEVSEGFVVFIFRTEKEAAHIVLVLA
jgi:hypothetical protein